MGGHSEFVLEFARMAFEIFSLQITIWMRGCARAVADRRIRIPSSRLVGCIKFVVVLVWSKHDVENRGILRKRLLG
jgi:hypothetical protein